MQFPKSTPDLQNPLNTPKRGRKSIRRQSKEVKEQELKVFNPFKYGQEENYLPQNLRQQIQKLDYISSKSIKNIQFQEGRRVSNFEKNLHMMQELALKQQEKYKMIKSGANQSPFLQRVRVQEMIQPLNLDEQDQISLQLNGFYDYKERIEDDFNIFNDEMDEEPVMFYSNQEFQPQPMDDEMDNYLG